MRDFRDAKAMAHALRNGLKAKAVEATHSECLELLAKAFGFESWNVLSAKIEATQSPEPDRQAHDLRFKEVLSCSFSGMTQHEVKELIAGPSVFVCDECVGLCNDIIDDNEFSRLLEADEESGESILSGRVGVFARQVHGSVDALCRGPQERRRALAPRFAADHSYACDARR